MGEAFNREWDSRVKAMDLIIDWCNEGCHPDDLPTFIDAILALPQPEDERGWDDGTVNHAASKGWNSGVPSPLPVPQEDVTDERQRITDIIYENFDCDILLAESVADVICDVRLAALSREPGSSK